MPSPPNGDRWSRAHKGISVDKQFKHSLNPLFIRVQKHRVACIYIHTHDCNCPETAIFLYRWSATLRKSCGAPFWRQRWNRLECYSHHKKKLFLIKKVSFLWYLSVLWERPKKNNTNFWQKTDFTKVSLFSHRNF